MNASECCYFCGGNTNSDSFGIPLCNEADCIKAWFSLTYIERLNLTCEHKAYKEDTE